MSAAPGQRGTQVISRRVLTLSTAPGQRGTQVIKRRVLTMSAAQGQRGTQVISRQGPHVSGPQDGTAHLPLLTVTTGDLRTRAPVAG